MRGKHHFRNQKGRKFSLGSGLILGAARAETRFQDTEPRATFLSKAAWSWGRRVQWPSQTCFASEGALGFRLPRRSLGCRVDGNILARRCAPSDFFFSGYLDVAFGVDSALARLTLVLSPDADYFIIKITGRKRRSREARPQALGRTSSWPYSQCLISPDLSDAHITLSPGGSGFR